MMRRLLAAMIEAEAAQAAETNISFVMRNARTQDLVNPWPSPAVSANIELKYNGAVQHTQQVGTVLGPHEVSLTPMEPIDVLNGTYPLVLTVTNVKIEGANAGWGLDFEAYDGIDVPLSMHVTVSATPGGNSCIFTVAPSSIQHVAGTNFNMGITIWQRYAI